MKKMILALAILLASLSAQALQPYISGDKLPAGDVRAVAAAAEQRLTAAGFQIAGKHFPKGIASHGVIIASDTALVDSLRQIGGPAILGAPLRVGVKADGSVSYLNLEYWLRAYLRKDYSKAEPQVKAAAGRLEKALGTGKAFGGEVPAEDLPEYRYMFGMERFMAKAEVKSFKSFEDAVATVEANLAKGVAGTAKAYELTYPDRKLAVIGFAQNDPEKGEAWWVNKIGADHIAALPWELLIVDGTVYSLHARYRTALAWPSLGMGQFMGISRHPDYVRDMAEALAGVQ